MKRASKRSFAQVSTPIRLRCLVVAGLVVGLAGCASPEARAPAVVNAIEAGGERYAEAMAARRARHLQTSVARFERIHRGEAGDET